MTHMLLGSLHRLTIRLARKRRSNTVFGFVIRALPAGMRHDFAHHAGGSGKSEARKPSSQPAYGQRVEDLTRLLGKNSGKFQDGVKVPTVSHPITKEDLTRRST